MQINLRFFGYRLWVMGKKNVPRMDTRRINAINTGMTFRTMDERKNAKGRKKSGLFSVP